MLARGPGILLDAWQRRVAVAAFTTYTLESTRGICRAAAEAGLPVIVQAGSSSFAGVGRGALAAAALAIAEESPHPVGVHLDHSTDLEEIRACVALGYSSVMVDGSRLDFADNVELTRLVVRDAHRHGVWVEAELGSVPGDENSSLDAKPTDLTSPARAEEFVGLTGVDALAVAVGSVHGMTEEPVHLDLALLGEIAAVVPVPLVLHGASGLDDRELTGAVRRGMAKVNFNTELRRGYLTAIRASSATSGDDVVSLQLRAIDAVAEVARVKLDLVSSPERAGRGESVPS